MCVYYQKSKFVKRIVQVRTLKAFKVSSLDVVRA